MHLLEHAALTVDPTTSALAAIFCHMHTMIRLPCRPVVTTGKLYFKRKFVVPRRAHHGIMLIPGLAYQ